MGAPIFQAQRRDKEGLGANCRSINNKKSSITDILESRAVDVGVFSELNTKKPPKFKGFTSFSKTSKRRFHGIAVYIRNHLKGHVYQMKMMI